MSLRIGLVGAGWAAGEHTASLAALGEPPPVAVTDIDPAAARLLARRCGAAVADDLDALIGHRLDAALVTTPAGAHAEAIVGLLEAGAAVFVEKPLTVTTDDARAVVAAAVKARLPVAVGYQWRAVPALLSLRDELAGQRIALLVSQGIGITQARPWFADGGLSAGLVGERGSHHLDLVTHLGGPVTEVRAVGGGVRVSGGEPIGTADVVSVTCRHANGAVSMTALVWASAQHLPEQSLRVVSDGGHYLLALDPEFRLTGRSGGRDVRADSAEVPFVRQLARFLGSVRSGAPGEVFCTAAQAARTVAVVAAAGRSLATGEAVGVEPL